MKIGILNEMLDNICCSTYFSEEIMELPIKKYGNPAQKEELSLEWSAVRNMPVSVKFDLGKVCFLDRVKLSFSDNTNLVSVAIKDKNEVLSVCRAQTDKTIDEKTIFLEAGSLTDTIEIVIVGDFSDIDFEEAVFFGAFEETVNVFPTPVKSKISDNKVSPYVFASYTCGDEKAQKASKVLKEKYFEIYGVEMSENDKAAVVFGIDETIEFNGYRLNVTENGAQIFASDVRGFVMGVETFIKLCTPQGVCCAEISDAPMCEFRGVHLYIPGYANLDFARRLIKYMISPMGYNNIIFNIAAGMEYESHPEINEAVMHAMDMYNEGKWPLFPFGTVADGSYLKKKDLKELLDYVRSFGIAVIPEIQSLGHVQYLTQAFPEIAEIDPEAEKKKIDTRAEDAKPNEFYYHSYCPSNPKSYELMFDIIDEVVEVFQPEEYVHMGHDEVYQLGVCPICSKKDPAKLYSDDVIKLYNYLKEKGMKMILWADMIQPVTHYASRPAIDMLPKDILMLDFVWYFWLNEDIEENLLEKGYKVGVGNLYSSHFPRYESRIRKLGMVGGQISTWTPTCEEKIQKEGKFFDIMMTSQMLWSADYKKEFTLTYDRMISSLMPYIRQNLKNVRYPSLTENAKYETIIKNEITFPPKFPVQQITSFDVNGDYDSVIFSHTELKCLTKMPWVVCEEVAQYVLTFSDGSTEVVPVTSSGNIAYWNRRQNEPRKHQLYRHNGYNAVYYSDGELSRTADGEKVTVYNFEYILPGNKKLVKVELVPNEKIDTNVFLCKLTGVLSGK